MKKKSIWLVLSCLMVAALVVTSCGPAVTEEEEEEPAPTGDETITFPDENLAAAVRAALGKGPDEEITGAELGELTSLGASERGIADLTGIEYCVNLTELSISPLANLTNLTNL